MPREAMDAGHRADQERWPVIRSLLLLLLLTSPALLLLLLLTASAVLLLLLLLLASSLLLLLLLLPGMVAAVMFTVMVTVTVAPAAFASRAVPRARRPDDLLGRAGRAGGLRLHRDRDDEGRSRHDGSSQCVSEHGNPSVGSVLRKRTTSEYTELESIHRTLDLDPGSHAKGIKRLSHPSGSKQALVAPKG